MLKLLDIPNNSIIHEPCSDGSAWFEYIHADGMYSYCRTERGAIVHLGLSQPLVPFGDGYRFAPEDN